MIFFICLLTLAVKPPQTDQLHRTGACPVCTVGAWLYMRTAEWWQGFYKGSAVSLFVGQYWIQFEFSIWTCATSRFSIRPCAHSRCTRFISTQRLGSGSGRSQRASTKNKKQTCILKVLLKYFVIFCSISWFLFKRVHDFEQNYHRKYSPLHSV